MKERFWITEDQRYLLERLNAKAGAWGSCLTRPVIERLNALFGVGAVTSAMRGMHGFYEVFAPRPYLMAVLSA
jgi:hypothetical protein